MKKMTLLGMILLGSSALAYADYDAGLAKYRDGNFASAAYEWKTAAEQGDGLSQFALGQIYEKGRGVKRDLSQAYKWYQLAADNNIVGAQVRMADFLLSGRVKGHKPEEAAIWLNKAAKTGSADAQFKLGLMSLEGVGVKKDESAAAHWFELAANQGHLQAMNNIGSLYQSGRGVKQDFSQAFKYFNLAAQKGDAMAQNNLGLLYSRGQGVARNDAWAVFWFTVASNRGNTAAAKNIPAALKRLQEKQVSGRSVNVRSGAGTKYRPVTQLSGGNPVYVLGEMDGWSQVYFEKDNKPALGWMSSALLK